MTQLMTLATTITEFRDNVTGERTVRAFNNQGLEGILEYRDDEATIIMYPATELETKYHEHPEDAMTQFLAQFLDY